MMKLRTALMCCLLLAGDLHPAALAEDAASAQPSDKRLQAGAAAIDITPTQFPVIVSCMFEERTANSAVDRLHARAIVLDDGGERAAIVIVDSCMLPRELLDDAKGQARQATGIREDHMLIAATHTHSAPSAMGCLGSDPDPEYVRFLVPQLVRVITEADKNLTPAEFGWIVVPTPRHTHNRRWILRSDRVRTDPFGQPTVRANMHPGHMSPDFVGPSGPVDTDLTLLAFRDAKRNPVAVLANYSMHYVGSPIVSADYYGAFNETLESLIGKDAPAPPMCAMSQGTSGDAMWMDYASPPQNTNAQQYAAELAKLAHEAYQRIEFRASGPIRMAETKLNLMRRTPDEARLNWAKAVLLKLGDAKPRGQDEVYAREQVLLAAEPRRELKLQALCIGDFALTATPNEVFSLTGLKLKAFSPITTTINLSLANGADGYIPPPEQHSLGGYTTWPARTAGLEVDAEPKILESLLQLLETVSGKRRRSQTDPGGRYVKAVIATKPLAYWRLNEMHGIVAADSSGNHLTAAFEPRIALYLEGVPGDAFSDANQLNRAVHFAGGRLRARTDKLTSSYSFHAWIWSGLPNEAHPVAAYLFSLGPDHDKDAVGEHFGIGGNSLAAGRLFFFNGNKLNKTLAGSTVIAPRTWCHVALVRQDANVTIFLNGRPEITGEIESSLPKENMDFFIGGRCDGLFGLEGKVDDAAIYDRALTKDEVSTIFDASK